MPDDPSLQQLRQQFLKRVQESTDSQLFIKMTTRANSMIYRTLTLWLLFASLACAQTKAIVIEGQPRADIQKSFGLIEDSSGEAANNLTKIQAKLDAGPQIYPWFWPGATDNSKPYRFSGTIIIPNDGGRSWTGTGLTKFGDPSEQFGSQIVLRADDYATTFDGTTNRMTTSGASSTVTVVGRTVVAGDQYNSFEITGGTNAIVGWYGIQSVNVGANTWTLDRTCTSGTSTNIAGYYCPTVVRNHGVGMRHVGLSFGSKRLTSDTTSGSIGYHIATNEQSGGCNTGNHLFEFCAFNDFHTGILSGADLNRFETSTDWLGSDDNHADHLTALKTWFRNCENCFHFRNAQSVVHNLIATRALNVSNSVFRFDSGGKLNAQGVEVSGIASGTTQRILYLDNRVQSDGTPFRVEGFSFDGGNNTRNPQLIVTDLDTENKRVLVSFSGGVVNRAGTNDGYYLVDIQSNVHLRLENIQGIWTDSIRLREGAVGAGWLPNVVITGCVLGSTTDPEEVIDESSCDPGCTVWFYANVKTDGTPLADKVYTTP